ncbi:hypothetical protein [Bradyrhizobium cenepequi]|uniref:hypothetical protein n=1 Tax=Bradyrhizobium cenepequi TaxID=2821403 RepID=UPI00201C34EE|nr:hypothetical protein [Bradyrhizobium cenepequi]
MIRLRIRQGCDFAIRPKPLNSYLDLDAAEKLVKSIQDAGSSPLRWMFCYFRSLTRAVATDAGSCGLTLRVACKAAVTSGLL